MVVKIYKQIKPHESAGEFQLEISFDIGPH